MVRWLATDHEAAVYPDSDAIVVTAEEQEEADERARARQADVRSAIAHPPRGSGDQTPPHLSRSALRQLRYFRIAMTVLVVALRSTI